MKKHIIGLMLFSFIVVASAIIYSMFNLPEVKEVPAPAQYENYSSKTACWKMKEKSNVAQPSIRQAVLDVKTKQLDLEVAAAASDEQQTAHFFVKNRKGTRYLGSAQSDGANSYGRRIKFSDFFRLNENLDSFENLYVIAGTETSDVSYPPKFDSTKATAITLDYGK